ncbi:PIG-L deacetylase family protein [Methanobacterium formicicum]|uniref:LmbE family protein n=1 Tax=Methanobacterium formicicum (strain DSM 3637 / PP1) TaxID=1204725 RepID=K2RQR7_METFP|nr:PIG-L family deacetylase [Methanobacterium formicicum]EKF85110.1 LmbE family protein [Methanobacterium formicicum DSM 3637]
MQDNNDSKFKLTKGIVILIIVSILGIGALFYMYTIYSEQAQYSTMPEISSSDRVLIVSPHPDDESLGTGGIIKKALEKNASVEVVMVTTGDALKPEEFQAYLKATNNTGYKGTIGDLRHTEAINAVKALGMNPNNLIFLGYPDGSLKNLLETNWDTPYKRTSGSNQYDHSPYNFTYEKNAPYTGANVVKNMEQIMKDYKPTIIYYPDDGDDHPDHFATSAFVRYSALVTNYTGKSYTYLVHKGTSWPNPLNYQPSRTLYFPDELSILDADWYITSLNATEESAKEKAIKAHASQVTALRDLLMSFVRTDEIFASYHLIDIQKVSDANSIFTNLPSSYYQDVKNDDKTGVLETGDDLTDAGVAYDDNNVYLFSQSQSVKQGLAYNFHLRLFNGTDFKRIDILAKNGKAEYQVLAKNSINSTQQPTVTTKNNIIVITLPRGVFNGTKYMMVSVDLVNPQTNKFLDYLSYRVFKFPDSIASANNSLVGQISSGITSVFVTNNPGITASGQISGSGSGSKSEIGINSEQLGMVSQEDSDQVLTAVNVTFN